MNKRVQRSAITFILSIVAMIAMVLLGGKTTAQEAGGSELSLDNLTVTSFKIIDVKNGNREIDYRTSDNAQFSEYNSDPTKFSNALNEGQKTLLYKLNLAVTYNGQEPLKEGDTLTIPANLGNGMASFASLTLTDADGHVLGTWEYTAGNVIVHFSGDYIKNNRVTRFNASFETGDSVFNLSGAGKTFTRGERRIQYGQVGKNKLIVAREKQYIQAERINNSTTNIQKFASADSDNRLTWLFSIKGDYFIKPDNSYYYNPHLIENEGEYSPRTLTEIYLEDTFEGVTKAPYLYEARVWISGTNDEGNVISGDFLAVFPINLLTEVKQGSLTREEMKAALQKGQYVIYNNQDGTYTFMMKWWNMNDETGPTYDDLPQIKAAGGVGSFLKSAQSSVFGSISDETVLKLNRAFKGKAIQNVYVNLKGEYATALERKEIPNTLKFETAQTGKNEYKTKGVLTPSSGVADAPTDPLSIKLLKTDVKTGNALSEGFKFELQTSDDNGTTWKAVDVTANMVVSGTLNGDNTLTPNESGTVEVNSLAGGKKYRFFEKAHADGYIDVTEDNANPNTDKTPTAANSRVVEVNAQGSGKVVVMYNEQKPETVSVEGTKTWDDADNQDGKRPAQITVNLLKNGQKVDSKTVTEADGWKWTFDNLDKYENDAEITYTVEEETVEGYTATVNGYNITNTHTPGKTNVQVTKKWDDADNQDGKRPSSVTFELYADGQKTDKTLVLSEGNNWTGSFADLDEYKAGKQIEYTVKELEVKNGYVASILGSIKNGFVVTNTRATEKTTVEGTKTWDDANNQDGKRPAQITVNLLKNGEKVASKTVTEADGWKWSFDNLAKYENGKEITYTVEEETVEGYTATVKGNNITNSYTPEKTTVEGSKTWDDADNQDGKRPEAITINLLKNGEKVASKTVTAADGWKWSFDNLAKYENGKEITYSIVEEQVESYSSKVDGYNVTNSYTPGKTSVQVTKKWNDADDKDGKRPTSVTITLYADGEKTDKTLVLNKENNWTGNFTELDEYKAGEKIKYSIKEEPVGNGYVSEISGNVTEGFVVTNTRTPDPEVPVTPATQTTQTTSESTTTEERGKELPNTGTTGSLAVFGFLVMIAAALVLTVKTKKA